MDKLELIITYGLCFVGREYIWAGNGPHFDCSGLVQELLKAYGFNITTDHSSQSLYDSYKKLWEQNKQERGALAFFGKSPTQIIHVGFLVNNTHMLEAAGGDSTTTTLDAAQKRGAFVRVRPLANRKDLVALLLPPY